MQIVFTVFEFHFTINLLSLSTLVVIEYIISRRSETKKTAVWIPKLVKSMRIFKHEMFYMVASSQRTIIVNNLKIPKTYYPTEVCPKELVIKQSES